MTKQPDFERWSHPPGAIVSHHGRSATVLDVSGEASASAPLTHYRMNIEYMDTKEIVQVQSDHTTLFNYGRLGSVTALIPCYKNPKYLDLCLKSAVAGRKDPSNKILVVLDGFIDMFAEVMRKYENEVEFYGYEENRGMQSALNYGVFLTTTDYVFIVNDDNVFGDEWDVKIVQHAEPNTVVTVNQVEPDPSIFYFAINDLGRSVDTFRYDDWIAYEKSIASPNKTTMGYIFPFMISKRLYLACGGFDTLYNSPNVCDWDFFLKLQLLKVKATRVHNLHLYHFGSVITKKGEEAERFKQREALAHSVFEQKWGWHPMNQPESNIKFPIGVTEFNGIRLPRFQSHSGYLEWHSNS